MSSKPTRLLLPLSAALLLQAGSALASDHTGDAQAQAHELLSGKPRSGSGIEKSDRVSESPKDLPDPDAQAQARHFILGNSGIDGVAEQAGELHIRATLPTGAVARPGVRTPIDVQEMARRLLQGKQAV